MKTKTETGEFGLEKDLIHSLSRIFESTTAVNEVIIFGSRAMGNFSEGSDIDLAIKGKMVRLDTVLSLMSKVEGLGLLYTIDLQDYQTITDKAVLDHIHRVGKIFWKRESNSIT